MNNQKSIFVIIVLILSTGCKKEYEYSNACIYKTDFVAWDGGRGLYKLYVSYEFEYNDSIYKGNNPTKGLYQPWANKRYREGDSILIQYPKGKPSKSEVMRLIYMKDRRVLPHVERNVRRR
jgi:hypothetical protein